MKRAVFVTLLAAASLNAQQYTGGVGVYPGDPKEDFAPSMRIDAAAYRNLAEQVPANVETDALNEATLKGWAFGSDQFKGRLEKSISRRVSPAKRGRPPKAITSK